MRAEEVSEGRTKGLGAFDFVDSASHSKVDLIATADDPEAAEAAYVPYVMNRAMSYHADAIALANEMNLAGHLPKAMQYRFYLAALRPRSRRSKWWKREEDSDLETVKRFYGYNTRRALEALSLLTRDQIAGLAARLEKGGAQ